MSYYTQKYRYDRQALEQEARDRQTSDEILQAIAEVVETSEDLDRLWQSPTEQEQQVVIARAWDLASDDDDRLYWGATTIHRD